MAAERFAFGLDDQTIGGIPVARAFADVIRSAPKGLLETLQPLEAQIPEVLRYGRATLDDARQMKMGAFKDHPLTVDKLAAILKYSAQDTEPPLFKYMNAACYDPRRTGVKELSEFGWLLMNAMADLEPFPNRVVFRGVKKDLSAIYNAGSVGREFTWHSFTSCTKLLGVMDDPNFCGGSGKRTIFHIQLTQSQARYIGPFSNFPYEEEVLLPPCCRFRVISVARQDGQLTLVQLEEVESVLLIADLRQLSARALAAASTTPGSPAAAAASSSPASQGPCELDKPDGNGWTKLTLASYGGQLEEVRRLLEAGAGVDSPGPQGATPLFVAAQQGHVPCVVQLLEAGADVNIPQKDGTTPTYIAAQNGRVEVLQLLLEGRANPDLCHNDGRSPCFTAASKGHLEVVQELLKARADVHIPTHNGMTPCYVASDKGHLDTLKELLKARADPTVACQGWTPLRVAEHEGHRDVARVLKEALRLRSQ